MVLIHTKGRMGGDGEPGHPNKSFDLRLNLRLPGLPVDLKINTLIGRGAWYAHLSSLDFCRYDVAKIDIRAVCRDSKLDLRTIVRQVFSALCAFSFIGQKV